MHYAFVCVLTAKRPPRRSLALPGPVCLPASPASPYLRQRKGLLADETTPGTDLSLGQRLSEDRRDGEEEEEEERRAEMTGGKMGLVSRREQSATPQRGS